DLFELLCRCVALDLNADHHLTESRRRRVGHYMSARVELRACDRLESVIGDPELRRIEGEHRRIAADCAGEQKFKRRRRAILSADMHRLADEEFVSALLALDQFVELSDRGHLDLDETLRPLRCLFFWMGAIAALACLGDFFQFGKAIADFAHSTSPAMLRRACVSRSVRPREAGTHTTSREQAALDPRLRGNERSPRSQLL